MPWDLNVIMIVGRLTRDPELSYTQNNTPMCRFSIANNRGNQEGDVNFFDVVAWNKTAEVVHQVVRKGSQVAIEGKLKQNKFVDKTTGQNRSVVNIIASSVQFLGSPRGQGEGGGAYGQEAGSEGGGAPRSYPRRPSAPAQGAHGNQDDIVFEKHFDDAPPPGSDDEVPF
ncbi:MAG: single-stranded DNA-binding protein [Spirochaetes bacterium]|nr:single-stranded DNA-binding protein [Spirochaetota bacterium]